MQSPYANPGRFCNPVSHERNFHGIHPRRKDRRIRQIGCLKIAKPVQIHDTHRRLKIRHERAIEDTKKPITERA
jgi:hypothetical protein